MILKPLQKWPNDVGDLGKIIVDTGFEWLPKVKKIAQSSHTEWHAPIISYGKKYFHSLVDVKKVIYNLDFWAKN